MFILYGSYPPRLLHSFPTRRSSDLKATEVALVGDGKAIVGQLNKALGSRQWFHPTDSVWRKALSKKAAENAATIKPQIDDDAGPANYYRALRDVAAWMPKNSILSDEG